ncbi:MAG: NAD(P)/FAD-dependent oxidoreductase, partial [Nitrospinota bacterium]
GAYMAKAGLKVAVLEQSDAFGGGCTTREVTLPGFKHNLHSNYYVGLDRSPILSDLELHSYGLGLIYPERQQGCAFRDGTAFVIHRDVEKTVKSIARISKRDAKTYKELHVKFTEGMLDIITSFMYCAPLPPEKMKERFSGRLGREFWAYNDLSMYEAVDQHFEDERLRVLFKLFLGSFTLENTPKTGIFFPRIFSRIVNFALPVGGSANFLRALERVIVRGRGRVFTGAQVKEITVQGGRARGVVLADRTRLEARKFVASGVNWPLTVRLAGEDHFGAELSKAARKFQWASHGLCTVHLALKKAPEFKSARFEPDINKTFNIFWGAESTEEIDACFEAIHRGELPRLMGNGGSNTHFDPTYAPEGAHLGFWWPFAPFEFKDGGSQAWDKRRKALTREFIEAWAAYAPNLNKRNVMGSYLYTPYDIVRENSNMVRASHHIGAYIPGQLGHNRPHPKVSGFRTPVEGLYLCGSSSHVGGGVTGAPGYNCANAIADDLKLKRFWKPVAPPRL